MRADARADGRVAPRGDRISHSLSFALFVDRETMRLDPPNQRWNHLLVPGHELAGPRALLSDFPRAQAKPLFLLDTMEEALDAFEAGGAAVVAGALVTARGGGAVPVEGVEEAAWNGTRQFADAFGFGPSGWRCVRTRGEGWDAFVGRAAEVAREALSLFGRNAADRADGEVLVDLAWVTEDEPRLFHVPAYLREAHGRLPRTGRWGDTNPHPTETLRVVWTGAADGSFYGGAADAVAPIPPDARFARVNGRAKDLARLADLPHLEHLVVIGGDDRALAVVGGLAGVRVLEVSESRATTLDGLAAMPALEVLTFGGTRLKDASALARIEGLRALWMDVSPLRALDWAAPLTQLRSLFFTGGLTTLPTLAPLSGLADLRHLYVGHVRIKDRSLRPLQALSKLETLELPHAFPSAELAALAAALPKVRGIPREAFVTTDGSRLLGWCRACKSRDVVLTAGAPVRTLCRACDDAKIRKYALEWELALSQEHARARAR